VRVNAEAKSDPAGSSACDSEFNWGEFSLLITEDVTAVARALDALFLRNSAKGLAPTSTHCNYHERTASIRDCVVDEYS